MLAYALAFKPCSEVTDIGSILSWGSVFWRDLVRIRRIQDFPEYQLGVKGMKLGVQSYGRIWGFYGVTVGGEGAGALPIWIFSFLGFVCLFNKLQCHFFKMPHLFCVLFNRTVRGELTCGCCLEHCCSSPVLFIAVSGVDSVMSFFVRIEV